MLYYIKYVYYNIKVLQKYTYYIIETKIVHFIQIKQNIINTYGMCYNYTTPA